MRRTIVAVALGFALCATSAFAQDDKADPQAAMVESATTLIKDGQMAEALETLEPALVAYEKQYAGQKGLIFCAGSPEETLLYMGLAATVKKDAIAIGPSWCTALFLKGFALDDLGRHADAIAPLEKAVAMAPQKAHYLNELGFSYQQLKNWPKSFDAYQRAEAAASFAGKENEDAEKARAWRGQAFDLSETGKLDEAEALYQKCLKLNPNDNLSKHELQWIAEQRQNSS